MIKAVQPSVHQYDLTEKKITLLEPTLLYSLFKIADFLINASQKNSRHCNLVFSSYCPGILFAKKSLLQQNIFRNYLFSSAKKSC